MNEKELMKLLQGMQEYKRNKAEAFRLAGDEQSATYYAGEASVLGDVICALISPTYAQTLRENYLTE